MPKAKSSSASKVQSTSHSTSKSLRSQQTASKHGKESQRLALPIKKGSKTIQKASKSSATPSNSQQSSSAPPSGSSSQKNASKNKPKNAEKVLALLASKDKNKKQNSSSKKTVEKENKLIMPAQTAFELFSSKIWGMYKDDDKFQSCTRIEKKEIVKKSWSKLTKEKKQKYDQKAQDDEKRYQKESKAQKKKRVSSVSSHSQSNSSMESEEEPPSQETKKSAKADEAYGAKNQNVKKIKKVISKYNAFNRLKSPELKKENPELTFGELASKLAAEYKNLTEEEEAEIEKMVQDDKKRYDREIKEQKNSPSISKSKAPQVVKKSDVVMPKQVTTSFFVFFNKNRQRIKEEHPDKSVCELGKVAGDEWKQFSDSEKKEYDKFIEEDRQRYNKEMKQLQTKGYFVNADGVKSTDMKVKGSKGSRQIQREEGVVRVPKGLTNYKEGTMLPKNIRSPFFYFSAQCWIDVKKERKPDELFNYIKITQENAAKWKALSEEELKKFQVLYEADKQRRLDQFEQIKKKGYFMTEEGIKSTDLPVKKPKIKMVKKIQDN